MINFHDCFTVLCSEDTVQLFVNLENLNDNPPRFVDNQEDIQSLVVTAPEEVAPPLIVYTFDVRISDAIIIMHFNMRISLYTCTHSGSRSGWKSQ